MIINSHNLLPAAWAFLFNSNTKFYNTSPGVYVARLLPHGYAQQIFEVLFGHGYLNYRELFCVAKSEEEYMKLRHSLRELGFSHHDQHSFLDNVLVDLNCHIFRQDQYGVVVAIVQDYPMTIEEAQDNKRISIVEVWELMESRMWYLIKLMADDVGQRMDGEKIPQAYVVNWFGGVSRVEFLRAYAEIKAQMKLKNIQPKPAPRVRKKVAK